MLKNMFANSSRLNEERARKTIRRVKTLMLPVALLAVVRTLVTCSATSGSPFQLWAVSGLVRVGKTDAPGSTTSISLSGARGETVDAQVIVQAPSGGLSNVNVSASALTGPGGATIPASNITLYREILLDGNRHRELRRRQQPTAGFGHLSGAAHSVQ